MKKVLLFIAFVAFATSYTFAQGLIISEVVDGTGTGGFPKYVEITNATDASIDLNGYKINIYINGSTSASLAYLFETAYALPAKASVVLTNIDNATAGQLWADFNLTEPTYVVYVGSKISNNGDDVYELVDPSDSPVDVYGVIGTDGSGQDWEFLDSYSYRMSTIYTPSTTFDATQWYIAGANFLDGKSADLSPYITPGTHTLTTSTGAIDVTAPVGGESYNTGDVVTLNWTSSSVDSVIIMARMEPSADYFPIMDNAILASLGTFDIDIPTDAEEGDYKIKLVGKEDPTVADSSGTFHITDIHPPVLDDWPFYPENGAVDVPTDLFVGRFEMYMNEKVKTGTGNIYLKKQSDDSVVETFDVTNSNQVMIDPNDSYAVLMYISANLDPNTQFYIEVDAGAIIDMASTPNSFVGFSGSSIWSFTTGAFDSFMSIYDIQYTADPSGDSPVAGSIVKTSGIVMQKYYKNGTDYQGFYIQDAAGDWSGIYVYDPGNDDVNIGDELNVGGMIQEYYDFTQMQDLIVKDVISSSNTLYDPVVVSLTELDEPYESVLVTVENVSCSNIDLGYNEWELTDGTNTGRVDDMFFVYTPVQDEQFTSVTGILEYKYSNFKIEPRDAADIVSAPTRIRNVDDTGLVVGPNPVSSEIRISANNSIADVQVINLVGEVMDVETVGTAGMVNVATGGLANGLYLVKVTFTDGTVKTQKIIKR